MIRIWHLMPAMLAVAVLAEAQRNPYDAQRSSSASDAARRFDLTEEEQRCYDQQHFTQQELQMLRTVDDKLRNGEITRVRSTYPSNVSQTEREMFKERIYSAITSIAPNERAARIIKEKLENFVHARSQRTLAATVRARVSSVLDVTSLARGCHSNLSPLIGFV
ncbi:uncharacterized protein [Dermacentor andersoni]|uniref:uncharacterized protein isoform X1 n=1 Tax=Dermacentor andersoni TaxID=34620 RepID=UPI003B3A01C5